MKTVDIETHIQVIEALTQQITTLKEQNTDFRNQLATNINKYQDLYWERNAIRDENEVLKIKIKKLEEGVNK